MYRRIKVAAVFHSILTLFLCAPLSAYSETCTIAVSANFMGTAKKLKLDFEKSQKHTLRISSGSTGQIFAQIKNGAPFDVFLSADTERPAELIELDYGYKTDKLPQVNISYPYAHGQLVLWSPKKDLLTDEKIFNNKQSIKLAIANPKIAPYGKAAMDVLTKLNLTVNDLNIVMGENVSQALLFVSTQNADIGFVSLSQVLAFPQESRGSWWMVPENLYHPIVQQALLLKHAHDNQAAIEFFKYLSTSNAEKIISSSGYLLPRKP